MASSRWTDALLDEAGRQGDDPTVRPNADDLAAAAMSSAEGIRSQNELLQLVDLLMDSTALALTEKSVLRQKLGEYPPETLRYFEPAPAPEWLDEAKLRAASRLWHDNSLACVGALYSLSLPACYLCEEGVPALYATAKLQSRQYIYQRVYETMLFADDVLDEDGLHVLGDYTPELYLDVLKDIDPEGAWTGAHGGKLARTGGEAAPGLAARVEEEAKKRRKRFLWGRGFLAARKVRFLHASIRFMLQNPDKLPHRPAEAHDESGAKAHGPADQRDYLQQHWNRRPVRDERLPGQPPDQPGAAGDGAPHLRLHDPARPRALGLPDLAAGQGRLPPPLEGGRARHGHPRGPHDRRLGRGEGAARHRPRPPGLSLRRRQAHDDDAHGRRARLPPPPAGGTAPAPARPPDHRPAPPDGPALPRDDPGARGLRGRRRSRCTASPTGRSPSACACTTGSGAGSRAPSPWSGTPCSSALHRSSEELIESLRDQFRRRPFEVSGGFAWAHRRGATPQTEQALMRWRSRLFNNLAFAVFLLFVAVGLLLAVAVVAVLPASVLAAKWSLAKGLGLGAAGSVVLSWLWMRWQMPRVFSKRPDTRPATGATA